MSLTYRVIERFRGKYSVQSMCDLFEVFRCGYYAWRKRQEKPSKDQWLIDLIAEGQHYSKQTYGYRRMQRWLYTAKGKKVNIKAVLRVMRKYDLLSQVRRRRPYMRYQRALHKYPNLLNRQFEQMKPNQFRITDITYIPTARGMVYMCAVVDLCGKIKKWSLMN